MVGCAPRPAEHGQPPAPPADAGGTRGRCRRAAAWRAARVLCRRPRGRRTTKRRSIGQTTEITIPKASKRVVKMEETITVGELAQQLSIKAGIIIRFLMDMGEMVTVNHVLDLDTVTLIAQEHDFTVENVAFNGPRAHVNQNDALGMGHLMARNVMWNSCRESSDHGVFNSVRAPASNA